MGSFAIKQIARKPIKKLARGCLVAKNFFLPGKQAPGIVYLQSHPFSRLAYRIMAAAKWLNRGESKGIAGVGGSILGGLLGGDNKF